MHCLLRLWVYGLVVLASASAQAQGVLERFLATEANCRGLDSSYGFVEIPGVLRASAGLSLPSPRAVVDSSYDVGVNGRPGQ